MFYHIEVPLSRLTDALKHPVYLPENIPMVARWHERTWEFISRRQSFFTTLAHLKRVEESIKY